MALIVEVEQRPGEVVYGKAVASTMGPAECHVTVDQVPRVAGLHYHDVVAVDTTSRQPWRLLRIVERGKYGPALKITHGLDEDALELALEGLEAVGWVTRGDGDTVVWMVPPPGVAEADARTTLGGLSWVTAVGAVG